MLFSVAQEGLEGMPQRLKRKSVVENLKQKWDNLDERTKDYAQEKIIDPVKDVAKDKAKQTVKKGWNKLKNSKKFGPRGKKSWRRGTDPPPRRLPALPVLPGKSIAPMVRAGPLEKN